MSEGLAIPVSLSPEVVEAIVLRMEERGLVVPKEGRKEPYDVAEIVEVSGLGKSTIERIIHSGVLRRVPGSSRLIVSAKSVDEWLDGGCAR